MKPDWFTRNKEKMMTKLGIIGAMDVEVETLLAEMEQVTSTKKAGSTFHAVSYTHLRAHET